MGTAVPKRLRQSYCPKTAQQVQHDLKALWNGPQGGAKDTWSRLLQAVATSASRGVTGAEELVRARSILAALHQMHDATAGKQTFSQMSQGRVAASTSRPEPSRPCAPLSSAIAAARLLPRRAETDDGQAVAGVDDAQLEAEAPVYARHAHV